MGKEWKVYLKKQGKQLGVDVDLVDGKCLFIETIKPGLISDWNADNPDQAIMREDCIIQVDGQKGQASALTAACKKDEELELVSCGFLRKRARSAESSILQTARAPVDCCAFRRALP